MKIAVLADVHANFLALQAVSADIDAWQPDAVILAGDLVNRGPRPEECLRFVQDRRRKQDWRWVRGNHEDYVIAMDNPKMPRHGPVFDVHRPSFWTYQRLSCDVSALCSMPFQQSLPDPVDREVRIVHASMLGNRVGIYPETSDDELAARIGLANPELVQPAVLCVGHTHRALARSLDGTLVVNAGSAGLPFDGDTRPGYARLTFNKDAWQAEIRRVDYDLQAAERDFYESGYFEEAGPLVRLVQIELHEARSQLYHWSLRFQDRALQGEISMEESVRRFLGEV